MLHSRGVLMSREVRYLPLVDMAPVYAALDVPPGVGCGKWRQATAAKKPARPRARLPCSRGHTDILQYRGPTVVGLSDPQLEIERERLRRVREQADAALRVIDEHLAFRRSL